MLQPHGLLRAWRSFAGCALVHTSRCLQMRPEAVHLAVLGHGMAHVCAQLTSHSPGVVFALLCTAQSCAFITSHTFATTEATGSRQLTVLWS
jgi:hypothetical protein